jgi:hypothetical protein
VPASSDELQQTRDQLTWEQERKLTGAVEMWRRLHPGSSEEQARAALVAVAVEDARLRAESGQAVEAAGYGEQKMPEPASAAAMQAVMQTAIATAAGQLPAESGQAIMTAMVGVTEEVAEAIIPEEDTNGQRDDSTDAASASAGTEPDAESADDEPKE